MDFDHERIRATQAEEHVRILQETIRTLRADAQRERKRLRPLLERAEGVLAGRIVALADRAEVLLALRAELGKE